MTPPFAEDLSMRMGCSTERKVYPPREFFIEATRPAPVYFETDEAAFKGVCCVCHRGGVLGRCPNPECGLLMHFTCAPVDEEGGDQTCPVCATEKQVSTNLADLPERPPFWHEA